MKRHDARIARRTATATGERKKSATLPIFWQTPPHGKNQDGEGRNFAGPDLTFITNEAGHSLRDRLSHPMSF